ncbi:hypothetical protein [Clostridium butyricum]|uniref:hypothetical protein n=1 Tax=Clostridium butyricum TaxID=1492 RepID=UPI00325ABC53
MANKKITDIDTITSINDTDKIVMTETDTSVKRISYANLMKDVNEKIEEITNILNGLTMNFDTIFSMKLSNSLKEGMNIKTLGYYSKDDGGKANYIIENIKYDWSIPLGNGLYANIKEPKCVSYKQFGAYLDGVGDDSEAMIKCHKYADSIRVTTDNVNTYLCTVENHEGIIYKKGTEVINCCSDVDLSGSKLLIDDSNASWFGIYLWGDVASNFWDYELSEETQDTFTSDNFVIKLPSNDELPQNTVLNISEIPYSVRDDDGYLYSVGRKELIVHGADGICTSPFADDWSSAGGGRNKL